MDPSGDEARDPWVRLVWVLGVVWVVFMFFPVSAALRAEVSAPARTTAVVVLLVYGAVYIAAFVWMTGAGDWEQAGRRGLLALAVMVVLLIGAAVLAGPGALGAGAFLTAIAMFSGPVRRAVPLAATLMLAQFLALAIWLPLTPDGFSRYGILFLPPAIVFVTTFAVRFIDGAQDAHNEIERQRALVAERERVARDVHDTLGHSLTVVTVKAELAERLVDRDPERARSEIAEIRSLAREALAEVRATVAGLRVARLGEELVAAEAALRDAGVVAEVPHTPEVVDPRYRIVAAWVLREAVTNIVRHARARRCTVRLANDGIAIEDDGVGIPDPAAAGLRGIRERAEAAGASLTVGPAAGDSVPGGTRVEVRW